MGLGMDTHPTRMRSCQPLVESDFRVTICDYFPAKTSLKFAISTEIFIFSNSNKPLDRCAFCQY